MKRMAITASLAFVLLMLGVALPAAGLLIEPDGIVNSCHYPAACGGSSWLLN